MSLPTEFRDWAYLPPEIVGLISTKVKSIKDYVRFRAVCSSWCSASLPKLRHHPPQLPWLMLPYNPFKPGDSSWLVFYDFWAYKMHKFHIPLSNDTTCYASFLGWLLLVGSEGEEALLLNPITQARIQLPPFTDGVDKTFANSKLTFSANPTDPNCMITVFSKRSRLLFCCQVGDSCWTMYRLNDTTKLADVTYNNGLLYMLYEGDMNHMMIYASTKLVEKIVLEPKLRTATKCFLEGKSEVYVLALHPMKNIEIYQLDEQFLELRLISDTSNNTAIFYADNSPCLAVSTDDWDSLDGGSVYLDYNCSSYAWKSAVQSLYRIYCAQWGNSSIRRVVQDPSKKRRWPPEPAMWFQPSFF
ncbi:F-box family protein [Rhynchospora pubera]|uniref:F-box family protein n=1 Tax=Rhynchospora pubera TaxID=906938 RepID=A0AAV8F1M1_9POAL|nr:F-box family protein [Rhynchospora pubera]